MSESRLRLLCCWDYARPGWVAPLESLGIDHGFDLTYLFHRRAEEETAVATVWPRRYWLEFRDAQQVLDHLRPDRIVFMGLDGTWSIALNAVARRRGIPTFLLQHGIDWPPRYFPEAPPSHASTGAAAPTLPSRLPALRFLARTLALRPDQVLGVARLVRRSSREGFPRAARRRTLPVRVPDLHLVTGPASALAPVERDGAVARDLCIVGLPEFHGRVAVEGPRPDREDTVLLLDTPHTGTPNRRSVVTAATKAEALRRLGRDLQRSGLRLRVKLHPYSYGDDWAVDGDGVTYLRDVDLDAELTRAAVVVGFESTLMILAMARRPCLLVRVEPSWLVDLAALLEAAPVVDGLAGLSGDRVVATLTEGRRPAADELVAAFAGPPPWSTTVLAAAIRDPATAPRLDPQELLRLRRLLDEAWAAGHDRRD